ncbi:MAG: hypothetical protein AAFX94_06985, partial [Myxococcota bacterium]
MMRDTWWIASLALLAACGSDELLRSQTSRAPLIDVPDRSPCQGVSDFRCTAMDLSCPGEDPGACLEESRDDLPGWCEVHSGAERCVAGAPSAAYLSYCRV